MTKNVHLHIDNFNVTHPISTVSHVMFLYNGQMAQKLDKPSDIILNGDQITRYEHT
jgi:hypothetical protein